MSWDSMGRDRTLAVVDSKEAADALVDKYSEQYPNAYIDYTNSLWLLIQQCNVSLTCGMTASMMQASMI